MEQSRLEPVALAAPLTIPLQGQKLLDQVLRESAGKRIQKEEPQAQWESATCHHQRLRGHRS